ncbi:hypothetical protein GCM10022406_04200 [Hymenobacter algoricola]|uniref:Uncharacterized protein n=1 Tax=Hymenobacter algoricola TaxID=486267 RepID=A0ABP7MDZ6_9BACT
MEGRLASRLGQRVGLQLYVLAAGRDADLADIQAAKRSFLVGQAILPDLCIEYVADPYLEQQPAEASRLVCRSVISALTYTLAEASQPPGPLASFSSWASKCTWSLNLGQPKKRRTSAHRRG